MISINIFHSHIIDHGLISFGIIDWTLYLILLSVVNFVIISKEYFSGYEYIFLVNDVAESFNNYCSSSILVLGNYHCLTIILGLITGYYLYRSEQILCKSKQKKPRCFLILYLIQKITHTMNVGVTTILIVCVSNSPSRLLVLLIALINPKEDLRFLILIASIILYQVMRMTSPNGLIILKNTFKDVFSYAFMIGDCSDVFVIDLQTLYDDGCINKKYIFYGEDRAIGSNIITIGPIIKYPFQNRALNNYNLVSQSNEEFITDKIIQDKSEIVTFENNNGRWSFRTYNVKNNKGESLIRVSDHFDWMMIDDIGESTRLRKEIIDLKN